MASSRSLIVLIRSEEESLVIGSGLPARKIVFAGKPALISKPVSSWGPLPRDWWLPHVVGDWPGDASGLGMFVCAGGVNPLRFREPDLAPQGVARQ